MQLSLFAFGIGIGTKNRQGDWLEIFYAEPMLKPSAPWLSALASELGYQGGNEAIDVNTSQLEKLTSVSPAFAKFKGAQKPLVATFLATDDAPAGVPECYLKLHLLSHRLLKPREQNLTGIFKILPNVAWTNLGPIDVAELAAAQLQCRLEGKVLQVESVDKFPKMADYVVPSGVRICDALRVRLGAYLGDGTTMMHEGFFNFNAGTEGPNMIEGRVSSSVWVGAGADLGGGCSTMGILSGGNAQPISVGKKCLLGANAGLGIPLGDECTIEAGLYLTAASKVRVLGKDGKVIKVAKAADLANRRGLLFRRNSQDGAIECLPNKGAIALDPVLHNNT